jgi:hypothetical protein
MPALSATQILGADSEFAFLGKPYRLAELAEALRALQGAV